ncbi:MAG: histidinol-phosphate transaminase [Ardenticatenales bacterium]|nr:histidinol-phosphate transaminase [Ardenticatenales bacterium]
MSPLEQIKPQVRAMKPYTLTPHEVAHKMNQNENPLGFPEALKDEVLARMRQQDWARYPDFHSAELTEALARHIGLSPSQVIVGNGSNELIYSTLAVTVGPGDAVVIPVPTFSVYKLIATVLGATVHEVLMQAEDNFALPTEQVLALAQAERARIVVLCSPNNPTAQSYSLAEIRRLCAESGALILLDEAYQEFSAQNLRGLLDEFPNVVLLRTFSKAMAMGGLRAGYALTSEVLAQEIRKGQLPYALNSFTATAAVVALENMALFEEQIALIRAERERLFAGLVALSFAQPVPSDANFILIRFEGHTPQAIFDHLLARGILVRDVSASPGLAGYLRLTVGAPHENDALLAALGELAQGP